MSDDDDNKPFLISLIIFIVLGAAIGQLGIISPVKQENIKRF
jgi:hypothetical protein